MPSNIPFPCISAAMEPPANELPPTRCAKGSTGDKPTPGVSLAWCAAIPDPVLPAESGAGVLVPLSGIGECAPAVPNAVRSA